MKNVLFTCDSCSVLLDVDEVSVEEGIKCIEEQYGWEMIDDED